VRKTTFDYFHKLLITYIGVFSLLSSAASSLAPENLIIIDIKIFDIAVESQLPRYHVGIN